MNTQVDARSPHQQNDEAWWLTPALLLLLLVMIGEWALLSGRYIRTALQQQRADRNLRFPLHHVFHGYGLTMRGVPKRFGGKGRGSRRSVGRNHRSLSVLHGLPPWGRKPEGKR